MDVIRAIKKMMGPLQRRVLLMVSRSVVKRVDDSKKCQTLQVELLADELRDDVEHFQPYGFTSVPFVDSEAMVLCVAGSRDHPIAVCVQDRTRRPKGLEEGDVALYRNGVVKVLLKANGEVHLGEGPTDPVALSTPTKDEISALRNTVNSLVSAFNSHIHTTTATVGTGPVGVISVPTSSATPPATVGDIAATEVKAK